MLLADGDILYVPVSYKKVYSLRMIEAAIGVATGLAIYDLDGFGRSTWEDSESR